MNDPLQLILQQTGLKSTPFAPTSRYYGLEIATYQPLHDAAQNDSVQDGPISYVRRRFVPAPERFSLIQEHSVVQNERPDHIATTYLGDPERFWQLCDANGVMHPNELTETIGKRIRITLPEGIPGPNNA